MTVTYPQLVEALAGLGVERSHPVIVHASLSAFGQVAGGAQTVVDALTAVFPRLMAPTFTYKTVVIPEAGPPDNALVYGSGRDINRMAAFYHPGMPADSEGRFYWLLDKIVKREGIGDVLADGTYWAAKKIGNGAEAYAHNNIRKHEQLPLKLGMLNPIYFLMYCTGEKASITQIEGNFPQAPFATREERRNE